MGRISSREAYNPAIHFPLDANDRTRAEGYIIKNAPQENKLLKLVLDTDYKIGAFYTNLPKAYRGTLDSVNGALKRLDNCLRRNTMNDPNSEFIFIVTEEKKDKSQYKKYIRVSKKVKEKELLYSPLKKFNIPQLLEIVEMDLKKWDRDIKNIEHDDFMILKDFSTFYYEDEMGESGDTYTPFLLGERYPLAYLKLVESCLNINSKAVHEIMDIDWLSDIIHQWIYEKDFSYINIIEKWINSSNMHLQYVAMPTYGKHLIKIDKNKFHKYLDKLYSSNSLYKEEIVYKYFEIVEWSLSEDDIRFIKKIIYDEAIDVKEMLGKVLGGSINNTKIIEFIKKEIQSNSIQVRECLAIALGNCYETPDAWELTLKLCDDNDDLIKFQLFEEALYRIRDEFDNTFIKNNEQKLFALIKKIYQNIKDKKIKKRIKALLYDEGQKAIPPCEDDWDVELTDKFENMMNRLRNEL